MAVILRTLKLRSAVYRTFTMAEKNISNTSALYEKAVEDLKNNPFFEKYSQKIATLQQCSPDEFQSRIESNSKRKESKPVKQNDRQYSSVSLQGKPQLDMNQFTKQKKLDDIMKTELLADKSADDVKHIWFDYHKDKDVLVSVIPKETYSKMEKRAARYPTFVLPIPRSQGFEFIMLQILGNEYHFTPLISYQTHKENAPECLTLVFYTELREDKGIILMKGEYDPDILNCQEAQCLVNELQLYYAQNNKSKLAVLEKFTNKPSEFDHMELISELENL